VGRGFDGRKAMKIGVDPDRQAQQTGILFIILRQE
jgi:hypothetical protein